MSNRDCKHGQLARSCNICELEEEANEKAKTIPSTGGTKMKTLYEVNWHYDNDTLARISVSPIKVLREGILPGCSSVSITAVDSNGREFLGCPQDYFESEEAAWEQTKIDLQETIASEERDVCEAQRRIEGLRNVLLAIQGAEPVRETGPVVTDEMIEALQRIWETAMKQTLVARIPECGEFSGIAQDAGWLLDALKGGES